MDEEFKDTDNMKRSDDTEIGLKVNRVVPVWSIILVVVGGIMSLIQSYYGQIEQAKNTTRLEASIATLTLKLDAIVSAQAAQNLKDAEHDLKISYINDQISNIRNRLTNVEAVLPRQYIQQQPQPPIPQTQNFYPQQERK